MGGAVHFLDTDLYERQGKAVNNFSHILPEPQGDLARQTLKYPYCFDFLALTDEYREREMEDALTQNITRFRLELGQGFSYVGRQVPLEVGDETVFADLLFHHIELRCYVVVELKASKFKAEHLGQLGLYVSSVNHLKKKASDKPAIGLLICKTKYNHGAICAVAHPIGISEYQLSQIVPENIKPITLHRINLIVREKSTMKSTCSAKHLLWITGWCRRGPGMRASRPPFPDRRHHPPRMGTKSRNWVLKKAQKMTYDTPQN